MSKSRLRLNRGVVSPRLTTALAVFSVLIVFICLLAAIYAQSISDYLKLRGYTAPEAISGLATKTSMTDTGRKLFYVNHPEVDDRSSFNAACKSRGEQTIVLGCYHSPDKGIFIFSVQDVRLDGVEEVTAAHEMLHAAYDRLDQSERKAIDRQLQQFFDKQLSDQRIKDTIEAYKKSEPNDLLNEMHSIFATEINTLTPELEKYYKQYFSNRPQVVSLAANYQSEFTRRQDQVKAYDARLSDLKYQIDSDEVELNQREAAIFQQRQQLDKYRASGDVERYNANVPEYNAKIDAYNALIRATQERIAEYNGIVKQRNSLALEVQQLTQSINSQPTPIGQ